MFESLDYFIKNKENYYKKEEIELLKNIKNDSSKSTSRPKFSKQIHF